MYILIIFLLNLNQNNRKHSSEINGLKDKIISLEEDNRILRNDNEKLKRKNGILEKEIIDYKEFHENEMRRMKEELMALKQNMVIGKIF